MSTFTFEGKVEWVGKTDCDVCGAKKINPLIDGRTSIGTWGVFCVKCFKKHGRGFGVYSGQKYELSRVGNRYVQTAGGEE